MADARPEGGQGGRDDDGRGRCSEDAAVALQRFFALFIGKPMFLLSICIIMLPGTLCPKRPRFLSSSSLPFSRIVLKRTDVFFCVLYLSLVQFRKQPSFLGG